MLPFLAPLAALFAPIVAVITKAAAVIGPAIAKFAPIVLQAVGKYLPIVCDTLEAIGKILQIISPQTNTEDIGAKAMTAEKKPEDFQSFNEYINYLESVEVDTEKLSQDDIDVAARQAIGSAIMLKGIGEILNVDDISLPFIKTISELELEPKLIIEILKVYADKGLDNGAVSNYFDDTLDLDHIETHRSALLESIQRTNPDITLSEAKEILLDLR